MKHGVNIATPKSRLGSGWVSFHSQARGINSNVSEFMQQEAVRKNCIIPIANFRETKISVASYNRTFKGTKFKRQHSKDSAKISRSPSRKRNVLPRRRQLMRSGRQDSKRCASFLLDGRAKTYVKWYILFLFLNNCYSSFNHEEYHWIR